MKTWSNSRLPTGMRVWLLAAAAHAAATAAAAEPDPAEPPPDDADTREIEAALAEDASEMPGDRAPDSPASPAGASYVTQAITVDIAVIADFAAAYFSDDGHLQTGGHDPTVTGFNLQQLELSLRGAVDPYFRFDSNIVFSLFGVEVEEAYATTLGLPYALQARFGQFLTRFGRLNPTHPHSWDFADQPFAIGRIFGAEANRGLGIELSWLLPLPWYVELIGSSTMAGGEATNRSFFGADDLGVEAPDDLLYITAVKQFFPVSEDLSLNWGLSGAFGPNSTGRDNRTDVYGMDIYLKYRPITEQSFTIVSLQTEWFYRRRQIPEQVLQDLSSYTQLFWRFAQSWGSAVRYEYGSPAYDADFDVFESDPLDPEWTASRHRMSANVTFWPTEFSRLRLQAARDIPRWRDGIWSVFLAAEVSTGAHGAHAF